MKAISTFVSYIFLIALLLVFTDAFFSGVPAYDSVSRPLYKQMGVVVDEGIVAISHADKYLWSHWLTIKQGVSRFWVSHAGPVETGQVEKYSPVVEAPATKLPAATELDPKETSVIESLRFRLYESVELRGKSIQFDPQRPFDRTYKEPLPILIRFKHVDVLVFKNPRLPVSNSGEGRLAADYRYPPLLVFCDKKGAVVATFQSLSESRLGGVFGAPVIAGAGGENLVWSTHTGGADMRFDHFLFDVSDPAKIKVYFDFVTNSASDNIHIRGHAEVLKREIPYAPEYGGRGHFLVLPKHPREQDDYRPLARLANLKFGLSFFTLGEFPNISHKGDESFVLMQMDPSRISFFPERAERFVYRAIELRDGRWHDASESAGAKAFYAAMSNFIFHELSALDGQERNWMLTSWAAYKAMLGEWGSFRETFVVKSDETAFRRSLCQLYALVEEVGTPNLEILKMHAYLKQERNEKEDVDLTECEGQRLIEFIEWEMKGRRLLGG